MFAEEMERLFAQDELIEQQKVDVLLDAVGQIVASVQEKVWAIDTRINVTPGRYDMDEVLVLRTRPRAEMYGGGVIRTWYFPPVRLVFTFNKSKWVANYSMIGLNGNTEFWQFNRATGESKYAKIIGSRLKADMLRPLFTKVEQEIGGGISFGRW